MKDTIFQQKQLAQSRPSGTSAASIYNPARNAMMETVAVANTTGSAAALSIYHDVDGTTYDQTTALFYSVSLAANSTYLIQFEHPIPIPADSNIAVQTDTGNALTFTIYGEERI